ncbi:DNA-binding protein [Pseudovirgaria hyperparasitica]|uniref:DNA-binding protein n=1 Tax=Pseudovirgaria hyperparasitica TaxID=470096 RepID=A0A6A6WG81_9PEZI|nr:DNA-binding protein [Pseudovirgaria hyperparasitica]KAF2761808.1 DNA-binding protein [Pseudovirgaria hyperparasitica]
MSTHIHLTTAFTSLLTAAIHSILYTRALYPRASFLATRFHNYPVHQSRHPLVCTWINDAVAAITPLLASNSLAHVVVVIYSALHVPLERFVFDVSRFPVVAPRDRELVIERAEAAGAGAGAVPPSDAELERRHDRVSVELSESFRAVMARLSSVSTRLAPLPPDCSFAVAVELKEEAEAPIGHPQPWIPAEPGLQVSGRVGDGDRKRGGQLGGARTVPVRAVEAGEMVLEVWVEEGSGKMEEASQETFPSSSSSSSSGFQ